jgi:DHA2 family multidrug resistance protein
VPLAAVTFATLAPQYRNEGTALFSLVRNVGSSIGISAVVSLLTRNTQILHARLAEHVTPFTDGLAPPLPGGLDTTSGLAAANAIVTQQSAMMAYTNDFMLMLVLTVAAIPLVVLLRTPRKRRAAGAEAEPMVLE